jgi:uncharacterized cupin superfamily protein
MTGGSGVIIRGPSVAESLRILLGEADCDGALGVVEMALSPGVSGPPLHLHPTHAEAFYVLAGELSLQVGEGSLPVVLAHGMRAQGRTPHAGKLWNRRRATPLHVCTRWFRATLRADAYQAAR